MDPGDKRELIAAATTAWRPDAARELPVHPAWHDLDAEGREQVFDDTGALRAMEAAIDGDGWSTTVRAVLARLGDGRG